jgi:hypothetical protein
VKKRLQAIYKPHQIGVMTAMLLLEENVQIVDVLIIAKI